MLNDDCAEKYVDYGKLQGWILCKKMKIQTFHYMFLMTDYIDPLRIQYFEKDEVLLCRADAPISQGNKLISGRNLKVDQLNAYLSEIKKCCSDGIVLVCQNPANQIYGRGIKRCETDGGVMIVFEENQYIYIEYVGRGFDVGDISKGRTVHSSLRIPWELRLENPSFLYKFITFQDSMMSYFISEEDYKTSRSERIYNLVNDLKEDDVNFIESQIPHHSSKLDLRLFTLLYTDFIEKVLTQNEIPRDKFGIMINIYKDYLFAFEVWSIRRSYI